MTPNPPPVDPTPPPGQIPAWAAPEPTPPTPQPVEPVKPTPRRGPNRPTWPLAIALVVVALLGGAFIDRSLASSGFLAPAGAPAATDTAATPGASATPPTGDDAFKLIRQAWDLLHEQYVGRADLNDQDLAHAAIDAITQAVGDTDHTVFMTPEQVKESDASLSGEYVGIGAIVDETDDGIRIEGVFPESPADKAGLGVGDLIVAVDGVSVEDTDVGAVADKIRGEAGTTVKVRVDPAGPETEKDLTLTRASVTIPVVDWAMVPDSTIAQVRLYQFSNGAIEKMIDALKAAKEAGATKIVLDLRSNPGGYVDQAIGIASQFLGEGNVFLTEDASGERTPSPVRPDGVAVDLPLVVLVDRSTASAAEIVASALQEGRHAPVIGEKTFGTGTVLNRFDLADGSALEIGVQRWLTRDGNALWHEGLTPDTAVTLAEGVDPVSPTDLE